MQEGERSYANARREMRYRPVQVHPPPVPEKVIPTFLVFFLRVRPQYPNPYPNPRLSRRVFAREWCGWWGSTRIVGRFPKR